jgi:hypothetical protein
VHEHGKRNQHDDALGHHSRFLPTTRSIDHAHVHAPHAH